MQTKASRSDLDMIMSAIRKAMEPYGQDILYSRVVSPKP